MSYDLFDSILSGRQSDPLADIFSPPANPLGVANSARKLIPLGPEEEPPPAEEEQSLLGSIGSGIGTGLGYVADTLSKPQRALFGTVSGLTGGDWGGGLLNLIPFSDTMGLTSPDESVTGRDLVTHVTGIENTPGFTNSVADTAADAVGLAADVLLDPLNLLAGVGGLTKSGRMAQKLFGKAAPRVASVARQVATHADEVGDAAKLADASKVSALSPGREAFNQLTDEGRKAFLKDLAEAGMSEADIDSLKPLAEKLSDRVRGGQAALMQVSNNPLNVPFTDKYIGPHTIYDVNSPLGKLTDWSAGDAADFLDSISGVAKSAKSLTGYDRYIAPMFDQYAGGLAGPAGDLRAATEREKDAREAVIKARFLPDSDLTNKTLADLAAGSDPAKAVGDATTAGDTKVAEAASDTMSGAPATPPETGTQPAGGGLAFMQSTPNLLDELPDNARAALDYLVLMPDGDDAIRAVFANATGRQLSDDELAALKASSGAPPKPAKSVRPVARPVASKTLEPTPPPMGEAAQGSGTQVRLEPVGPDSTAAFAVRSGDINMDDIAAAGRTNASSYNGPEWVDNDISDPEALRPRPRLWEEDGNPLLTRMMDRDFADSYQQALLENIQDDRWDAGLLFQGKPRSKQKALDAALRKRLLAEGNDPAAVEDMILQSRADSESERSLREMLRGSGRPPEEIEKLVLENRRLSDASKSAEPARRVSRRTVDLRSDFDDTAYEMRQEAARANDKSVADALEARAAAIESSGMDLTTSVQRFFSTKSDPLSKRVNAAIGQMAAGDPSGVKAIADELRGNPLTAAAADKLEAVATGVAKALQRARQGKANDALGLADLAGMPGGLQPAMSLIDVLGEAGVGMGVKGRVLQGNTRKVVEARTALSQLLEAGTEKPLSEADRLTAALTPEELAQVTDAARAGDVVTARNIAEQAAERVANEGNLVATGAELEGLSGTAAARNAIGEIPDTAVDEAIKGAAERPDRMVPEHIQNDVAKVVDVWADGDPAKAAKLLPEARVATDVMDIVFENFARMAGDPAVTRQKIWDDVSIRPGSEMPEAIREDVRRVAERTAMADRQRMGLPQGGPVSEDEIADVTDTYRGMYRPGDKLTNVAQKVASGRGVVYAFANGDVSTILHELLHHGRQYVPADELQPFVDAVVAGSKTPDVTAKRIADYLAGRALQEGDWGDVQKLEELFASSGEYFFKNGKLPAGLPPATKTLMERMRSIIADIYQSLKGALESMMGGKSRYSPEVEAFWQKVVQPASAPIGSGDIAAAPRRAVDFTPELAAKLDKAAEAPLETGTKVPDIVSEPPAAKAAPEPAQVAPPEPAAVVAPATIDKAFANVPQLQGYLRDKARAIAASLSKAGTATPEDIANAVSDWSSDELIDGSRFGSLKPNQLQAMSDEVANALKGGLEVPPAAADAAPAAAPSPAAPSQALPDRLPKTKALTDRAFESDRAKYTKAVADILGDKPTVQKIQDAILRSDGVRVSRRQAQSLIDGKEMPPIAPEARGASPSQPVASGAAPPDGPPSKPPVTSGEVPGGGAGKGPGKPPQTPADTIDDEALPPDMRAKYAMRNMAEGIASPEELELLAKHGLDKVVDRGRAEIGGLFDDSVDLGMANPETDKLDDVIQHAHRTSLTAAAMAGDEKGWKNSIKEGGAGFLEWLKEAVADIRSGKKAAGKATDAAKKGKPAATSSPSLASRIDIFKGWTGGTNAINKTIRKWAGMKADDAMLRAIDDAIVKLPAKADAGEVAAREQQIKDIAKFLSSRPSEMRSAKAPDFFGRTVVEDMHTLAQAMARRNANGAAIQKLFADGVAEWTGAGKAVGDDAVPLVESLTKAGMMRAKDAKGKDAILERFLKRNEGALAKAGITDIDALKEARIPKEYADAALNVMQFEDAELDKLMPVLKLVDKFTEGTKKAWTTPWVAFHTRNLVSGAYVNAVRRAFSAADYQHADKLYRTPYEKLSKADQALLDEMTVHNVADPRAGIRGLGSSAYQQASNLAEDLKRPGGGLGERYKAQLAHVEAESMAPVKPLKQIFAGGATAAEYVEFLNRGSMYLNLRRQGYTPIAAKELVDETHFNYSRMAPFERQVMRRLIPFYSFQRRNLPWHLEQLWTKPSGDTAKVLKMIDSLNDGAEPPEYVGGAGIPLGQVDDNTYRYLSGLGLPVEEAFGRFRTGPGGARRTFENYASGLNPLVKVPLELWADRQMFSGRDLSDLYPFPTGNTLADQVLANSPVGRVFTTVRTLADDRKGPLAKAVNTLSGVRITDVDMAKARGMSERDALLNMLDASPNIRESVNFSAKKGAELTPEEEQMLAEWNRRQSAARAAAKKKG